jgi:hypothetical protein
VKKIGRTNDTLDGKTTERADIFNQGSRAMFTKMEQYQKVGAQKILAGFCDIQSLNSIRLFSKASIP